MKVTQQFQCYAAEEALDDGRTFRDVDEAQAWVDSLRDTYWWHLQGYSLHVLRIEVGLARANSKFAGVGWYEPSKNAGRIELRPDALSTRIILHEVAHVIAAAVHGSKAHDPAWARTYLTVVSYLRGAGDYLKLRAAFDANGVNYDAPAPAKAGAIAL